MIVAPFLPIAVIAHVAETAGMTYQEAVARIPERDLPEWWVGDMGRTYEIVSSVERGATRTLAATPGRRPLHVVTYGERESVQHLANYNSAIGAREPSAYMDKAAREKPVVLFVGPVHGHEVEALTGLCNLIHIMETGRDLRGKHQATLRQLGKRCRLVIIPAGNPDGTARFEPKSLVGMDSADLRFWGQGTWADDSFCGWPQCKRQHPMVGDNVAFLGCYFDDAGINPMHDEFMAPMGPEAPAILKVAMEEGPDVAVSLHSHSAPPVVLRPAYVPLEVQEDLRGLAERFNETMDARDLPHGGVFATSPESGKNPAPFNLTSGLHHASGAAAFTFECPHGLADEKACQVGCEEILEMQLGLYEAMMRWALERKGQ